MVVVVKPLALAVVWLVAPCVDDGSPGLSASPFSDNCIALACRSNSACNVCGSNCGEELPAVVGVLLLEPLVLPDDDPVASPVAWPIVASNSDSGSLCTLPLAASPLADAPCPNSDCQTARGLLF